jgi:hypothetical protein
MPSLTLNPNSWTKTEVIADQLLAWSEDKAARPASGDLVQVRTCSSRAFRLPTADFRLRAHPRRGWWYTHGGVR